MISKPPSDWQREDRTVQAARQFGGLATKTLSAGASGLNRVRAAHQAFVAALLAILSGVAALAAGLIGRNIPVFLGAGCFSLLLGWMAFRSARTAFGRARKPDIMPDDRRGAWGDTGGSLNNSIFTTSLAEQTIDYDRNKLLFGAAKLVVMGGVLMAAVVFKVHPNPAVNAVIVLVLCGLLWRFCVLLRWVSGTDLTAIAWDGQQLRLRTLTRSRRVPWQSVESIYVRRRTLRLYGLIPISTSYDLLFRLRQNGSRRSVTISASMLTIRAGALDALMQRRAPQPAPHQALYPAPHADNDAEPGERRVFGRKGVATPSDVGARDIPAVTARDAVAWTPTPPRAFGRKVV
jgi:hypothetical protein